MQLKCTLLLLRSLKAILMSVSYSPFYGTDADETLSPSFDVIGDVIDIHSTIYGGGGNDTIVGGEMLQRSRYAFYGGAGNDTLKFLNSNARAYFSGGVGDDIVYVTGKLQRATGGDGYDTLHATNITINEESTAGFEALVLQGDIVFDDLALEDFQKVLVTWADITLDSKTDLSATRIQTTKDSRLAIHGSDFADSFDASSYSGHMTFYSGAGNDVITGNDTRMVADGGAGSDILTGGSGADFLMAGGRDDAQTDKIAGGGGNDTLGYSSGSAVIHGGDGLDTLYLYPDIKRKETFDLSSVEFTGIERLDLRSLDSRLFLGEADTSEIRSIIGGANILLSGMSILQHISAEGDVTITGTAKGDEVSFVRNDTGGIYFDGQAGDDIAAVSEASSYLSGGDGDDRLAGGRFGDRLFGGAGNDTIIAGDGDDDIHIDQTTSRSRDIVSGGGGEDTITFKDVAQGHGRISGGDGADLLDCKGDISGYSITGVESLQLRGAVTATAEALNGFESIEILKLNDRLDLTLDRGGEFAWKQRPGDSWGKITGSRQTDILQFEEAEGDWTFDLGKGDDVATFGLGDDTFVYEAGDGHDVIHEFATSGSDSIRIARTSEIQSFQDLRDRMMRRGDSLLIILDDDFSGSVEDMRDVIEITDMKGHHLLSGSFHFFDF